MKKKYLSFIRRAIGLVIAVFPLMPLTLKAQVIQTFSYTGSMQSFTVPSCVGAVTLEVWGAQGGANWVSNDNFGGYASAEFTVTAGNVLNVYVGEQPNGITGGFNGGGNGESSGQGGGGASDIRLGGTALTDRIIVAGGGGGAGYWSSLHVVGGQGGGLVGTDGYRMPSDPGGQGGTQIGSGVGTCASLNNPAMAGGLGYGGAPSGCGCEGYGGGGGYYGGAGSGNCRGGGGGSGYILSTATNTNFLTGTRVGHGQARISYFTNGAGVVANIANPLGICPGGSTTLNVSGVLSYTWSTGSNATSFTVSPPTTTSYTVWGTNSIGCISNAVLTVTVNALPTMTLATTNTFVCNGQTTTLTASGASTYAWVSANGPVGSGSLVSVNPVLNASTYTVTGTSAAGCVNTAIINVDVNPNELTTTSNTLICLGKQVVLTASGGNVGTYNWSNNMDNTTSPFQNISPTPSVNTIYSVSATDANNCVITKTISVTVAPNPTVTASTLNTLVCTGQPITLSAAGANSYSWNTSAAGQTISVVPALNILYTYVVTGTDANGCSANGSVSVKAEFCTALAENESSDRSFVISPNPSQGFFRVDLYEYSKGASITVYSASGALVKKLDLNSAPVEIDLRKEPNGIYFVYLMMGDKPVSTSKILKE